MTNQEAIDNAARQRGVAIAVLRDLPKTVVESAAVAQAIEALCTLSQVEAVALDAALTPVAARIHTLHFLAGHTP